MERFHHFWWYSPGIPWGFSHILLFSPPIRRFAWHARVWSRRHGTPRYSRNAAEPLGFGWEMVAFDGFWGWVASFASFGGVMMMFLLFVVFFCAPPPKKKNKTKGFQQNWRCYGFHLKNSVYISHGICMDMLCCIIISSMTVDGISRSWGLWL